jgi:hypothetical protein
MAHLAYRNAQGERLEDHGEAKDEEADPHGAELLRVRESLICLVDREDAATEEQEERDDQRPEVALLAVAERVFRRRRLHAPPDADIEEDLIHGVGDRVRGLGDQRAGAGDVCGDGLGDRDRQIAGERRQDRAGRALGHLPAVFAFGTGLRIEGAQLSRDG